MTKNFNKLAFEEIHNEFEIFSNLILHQLDLLKQLLKIYKNNNTDEIIAELNLNEKKIDEYENSIDKHIIRTIVLFKPVASDIRQLFSIYRMVINLERIGDLLIKISNYIIRDKNSVIFEHAISLINQMNDYNLETLRNALISFFNSDKELALDVIKNDEVFIDLNHKLLKKSLENIKNNKESQKLLLNLVDIKSIISCFERISDQSTNIAEASIYAIVGKEIRHHDFIDDEKI